MIWPDLPASRRVLPVALGITTWFVLLDTWPGWMWLSAGLAAACLGAAGAALFDEPAAPVTDVAPRGRAWQLRSRLPWVGLLLAVWLAGCTATGAGPDRAPLLLAAYGVGMVAVQVSVCCLARRAGRATPATMVGNTVFVLTAFCVLREPLPGVAVFPLITDPHLDHALILWITAAAVGAIVTGLVASDVRAPRLLGGIRRPGH